MGSARERVMVTVRMVGTIGATAETNERSRPPGTMILPSPPRDSPAPGPWRKPVPAPGPVGRGLNVYVIDAHAIFRRGLVSCLQAMDDVTLIGEAGSLRDAWRSGALSDADVIVVDPDLPGGIEVIRQLRDAAGAHVVVCSARSEEGDVLGAVEAGAVGYLRKESLTPETLATGVRAAANGSGVMTPEILGTLLRGISRAAAAADDGSPGTRPAVRPRARRPAARGAGPAHPRGGGAALLLGAHDQERHPRRGDEAERPHPLAGGRARDARRPDLSVAAGLSGRVPRGLRPIRGASGSLTHPFGQGRVRRGGRLGCSRPRPRGRSDGLQARARRAARLRRRPREGVLRRPGRLQRRPRPPGQRRDALRAIDAARLGLLDRHRQGPAPRRRPAPCGGCSWWWPTPTRRARSCVGRGVEASEVQEFPWGRFVFFADPDGNTWSVQQIVRPQG